MNLFHDIHFMFYLKLFHSVYSSPYTQILQLPLSSNPLLGLITILIQVGISNPSHSILFPFHSVLYLLSLIGRKEITEKRCMYLFLPIVSMDVDNVNVKEGYFK